ncbi:glycosyltransferase [Rhodopirellula europaea]|uniref:Glycosyl transferase, group 1 n=1 Tax=Rhodopirellula europaea 6C TaxID=1263867 RepID=M2AYF8_9BACT|nr:glycosyltransferase [Rhodopirellula europaea]EMB17747.1 glycosyl transferase, group 1 [Rhodopirellula europaea 6C]
MTPTLYITRNGMLEPLGQSQVLSYLRGLSTDYQITLISFEKPEDWADTEAVARVRADCALKGIRWLPQRFHYRPKILAPGWSMMTFLWLCLREVRRGNAELIHARSYIPAFVAMITRRLTGTPYIFDMRALWPEEMITAGRLRRNSWIHHAIVWAERTCLKRADTVVTLTQAAVIYLKKRYPDELDGQSIVVIPTCADLDRFTPPLSPPLGPPIFSCIGTVLSGWFRTEWLRQFLQVASEQDDSALFEIVTRDDAEQVRHAIDPANTLGARLQIFARTPQDMPRTVQRQTTSVMFYAGGETSELGRSPTRMAEILGCGIPVVANEGVGDVASIVREHRVGVIVENETPEAMLAAWRHLMNLRADPELSKRCRSAAERVFSLEAGTRHYREIYHEIVADRHLDGANERG